MIIIKMNKMISQLNKSGMDWLAELYMNSLNVIHYMDDKYSYERLEMALHDREILRTMAYGIAGLSVVADSLSARYQDMPFIS